MKTGDRIQERRFSAAGWSNDDRDFARRDVERAVIDSKDTGALRSVIFNGVLNPYAASAH